MNIVNELFVRAIKNGYRISLEEIENNNLSEDEKDELLKKLHDNNVRVSDETTRDGKKDVYEDSLKNYFAMITDLDVELLTKEEEHELFKRLAEGDESARTRIAEANLKLVVSIAEHYISQYTKDHATLSIEDLIQEGNLGLLTAIDQFDLSKGTRFSTYAWWWINQKIIRYFHDAKRTIRVPVHTSEMINKIKKYEEEEIKAGRNLPTLDESIEHFNLSEAVGKNIRKASVSTVSLYAPVGENKDCFLVDCLTSDEDVEDVIDDMDNQRVFEIMKSKLTDREYDVLVNRLGLDGGEIVSLEELGKKYNLTRERIRQVQNAATRKIKEAVLEFYELEQKPIVPRTHASTRARTRSRRKKKEDR